jgi:MoxR-like ATPase
MGLKLHKKSGWHIASTTTKTYGQMVSRQLLREQFGEQVTRQQLLEFKAKFGWMPQFIYRDPQYRISEGVYRIPRDNEPLSNHGPKGKPAKVWHKTSPDEGSVVIPNEDAPPSVDVPAPIAHAAFDEAVPTFRNDTDYSASDVQKLIDKLQREASALAHIPNKLVEFVPYGDYDLVKTIVESRQFHPLFISGLSGCGKTLNIKQACAEAGREYIRCPITTETDEDDLLGGFRLRKGETHFDMGPVIVAMIRGAVLLLDEIDKAGSKIMCLQPILENEPITLKKIGVTIKPAPGFTVFATANTKGQGDDTGKFITSAILDEAFLERFPIWIDHMYAPADIETEILVRTFQQSGGAVTKSSRAYCATLARWAENIRKAYNEAATENVISTRRLCHIVRTYKVLGTADKNNQAKALLLCLSRFDEKTKKTFLDLYNKHVNDDGTPSNVGGAPSAPSNW